MNNLNRINKVAAVIPFFNESVNLNNIITQTLNFVDFVIAVDDGSTDDSQKEIPSSQRTILVPSSKNFGKGHALNIGFKKSVEINSDITITLDSDLQHDPKSIPSLIEKMNKFDIVIGNRLNNITTMPLHRRLSNKITSKLLSIKTKQKIIDSQCGFRAYKTSILENILPSSNGFEAESEILINASKKNYRIGFTDIPTIYGNEKSKMKNLQTIKGFLKLIFS